MTNEPIDLRAVLATFDDLWNPRIAARINDYDIRVTHVKGSYIWHVHDSTDELFLTLDGDFNIAVRDPDERVISLPAGSLFVVPKGIYHRPFSDGGAQILVMDPANTPTTGDTHDPLPDHIQTHTGIEL
ncbi:cupin domain-containing protein [Kribbella ginsengisoli]|uniref:Cupin domain-containing protein n=1 Tax=Kribbella ginsengisoli TaxID=363865 RepID=A0ABP6W343_9ACTN